VCLIQSIHIIQLIQHNSALIYGVLGTVEVLFLATFITLRSNFINYAKNAILTADSHSNNATISAKWIGWARELLKRATSRTHSLNLSIWGFVIFLLSLGLYISSGEMHWRVPHCPLLSLISLVLKSSFLVAAAVFLIISIIFLILAIINFIFNQNAQRGEFSDFFAGIPGARADWAKILKGDET
jgi:hypothetical protein